MPQKSIWLYTGFYWEECEPFKTIEPLEPEKFMPNLQALLKKRYKIISQCDVLIDGRYIDSQRDISYPFAGSRNQRIISIQESIKKEKLYYGRYENNKTRN